MMERDVDAGPELSQPSRSNVDFAVVVGIDHYDFKPLRGAIQDAIDFHAWLCDPSGGGVDPKHARRILSDPTHKTPVQDEIDRELFEVLQLAHRIGGARRLYFYFSGHGATTRQSREDVALLLTRWQHHFSKLALSTDGYSATLCNVKLFAELAIFVDCCRSVSKSIVAFPPVLTPDLSGLLATRVLRAYASEAEQSAYEVRGDNVWNGIFTQQLLKIFRQAPDGVSAAELSRRLLLEVQIEAMRRQVVQKPWTANEFSAESWFGTGGSWPVLRLRFGNWRGQIELVNSNLEVVSQHHVDSTLWELRLPPDLYQICSGGRRSSPFYHDGREAPHDV